MATKLKYESLILDSATSALQIQGKDGAFPAGHNNKWNDIDTPIRVTSHFIIQMLFAYTKTNESKFLEAAIKSGDFLLSREARPAGKTFFCRVSTSKNMCNGLIGQSWPIEALVHLAKVTGDNKYLHLAADVYKLNIYDERYKLFCPMEIDGTRLSPAKTLNHQLIFAAVGLGLVSLGCVEYENDLRDFYLGLGENVSLSRIGMINHFVRYGKSNLEKSTFDLTRYIQRRRMNERSVGYHSFNLFGLALAHWFYPDFDIWQDCGLNKIINEIACYAKSNVYIENVKSNDYALQYRLTGQELLLFKNEFSIDDSFLGAHQLIERQFENHWDLDKKMLCKGSGDPETLSARLYEMAYLYMPRYT